MIDLLVVAVVAVVLVAKKKKTIRFNQFLFIQQRKKNLLVVFSIPILDCRAKREKVINFFLLFYH